jgi:hypothetical protein|tara:strand:+ start:319 stop:531 length:213 start_codon:yes stop_codon:yes gene_type:complete
MDDLDDTVFLPINDEYFGQNISIFKNTFIVKDVDNYKFLYLLICNTCIDGYLKKHGRIHKYLRNREIGLK